MKLEERLQQAMKERNDLKRQQIQLEKEIENLHYEINRRKRNENIGK